MTARPFPLLILPLCAAFACAQPTSLDQVLRGALERDDDLVMARLEAGRDRAKAEQKERTFAPKVSLTSVGGSASASEFGFDFDDRREARAGASLTVPSIPGRKVSLTGRYAFSRATNEGVEEMYTHDPQLALTVDQQLVGGGLPGRGVSDAVRAEPAALRATAASALADAVNDAVIRTVTLYYSVAEHRRKVEIADARLSAHRVLAENLERGASLRLGGIREARRERLSVREEELAIGGDRAALALLERRLTDLLGRTAGPLEIEVRPLAVPLDRSALLSRALTGNGDIRRADADLRSRQADAANAVLTEAPTVRLGLTLDGDYYTTDTVARTLSQSASEIRPRVTVSLLVDLPLGRGRDRELAAGIAGADVARAAARRAQLDRSIAALVDEKLAERARLAGSVELRAEEAALAREDLRVQSELLPAGQATAADVAAARLDLEEREASQWRARVDLFLLELELAKLAGEDLGRLLGL